MTQIKWQPDPESIQQSTLTRFLSFACPDKKFSTYAQCHSWSIKHREKFWSSLWAFFDIKYSRKWRQVVDESQGMFMAKWFVGCELNFAENLLRFAHSDGHYIALEFYNESGKQQSLSYNELYKKVAVLANAFRRSGLKPGDRVAAVLPNIPAAVIAMLACTSVGAIWSCCSADFGLDSLSDRFTQIKPKILLICDGYYYKGHYYPVADKISPLIEQLHAQQTILIPYANTALDSNSRSINAVVYQDYIQESEQVTTIEFEQLPFDHPVYILYSSGTTGAAKCMVHGAGGTLLQHLKELALHVNLSKQQKLFYYTATGWMMWNWQVSVLALGATLLLYDGCPFYPAADSLLRLVAQQQVTVFGCSAKYISSLQKANVKVNNTLDMTSLRTMLSTGSPLLAESFDYVYQAIKSNLQLCSISGGSDIISCFALGNPFCAVYRGELQAAGLAMAVEVYDASARAVVQQKGELVCTASFPSMPIYFWNDTHNKKYHATYFEKFPGIWTHGDYAEIIQHHGQNAVVIYGRSDTTLNPGGIRIGTAEIYRQCEHFTQIVDMLVVGQNWQNDQRIILFVQLQQHCILKNALIEKIKQYIRRNTSAHHVPAFIIQVHDIPKTYNGKLAELAVSNVIHHRPVTNLSALINPQSLDEYQHLEILQL